ncbi:MAG: hypothetical protein WBK28_04140 [Minisyncoccia bacterium]
MAIGDFLSDSSRQALAAVKASALVETPPSFERAVNTLYNRKIGETTKKQRDAALHDLITLYLLPETSSERREEIVSIFLDAEDVCDLRGNVSWRLSEEAPGILNAMNAFHMEEARKRCGL